MPSADEATTKRLRTLATDPDRVLLSRQAASDLMAWNLTKEDVCDAIVDWIDAGERVKAVVLHSFRGRQGELAFEMKPRLCNRLFYIKVTIFTPPEKEEAMLVISAHPDH
jgi:hypothetical protein